MLSGGVQAQAVPAPDPLIQPLVLKPSSVLRDEVPPAVRPALPIFLRGERMSGRPDLETVVEGQAELRRGNTVIRADRMEYYQPDDTARARGNVRMQRDGNVYEGPQLELKVETFEGFFIEPRFKLNRNDAHGEAQRVDFIDEKRSVIRNASYTTCRREPGPGWLPEWVLRAASIRLDTEEDVGWAEGAVLSFMGAPILPVPVLSFPLSDRRKSGFLPPAIGLDNRNGIEFSQPYYWNIASNRDATITPTLLSRRGVDIGTEFRYLEADYKGKVNANLMPGDALRNRTRWGLSHSHEGSIATGLSGIGSVGVNVNLNRVSDDDYWRDFARVGNSLTQRLLANDGTLSWARGDLSLQLRTLKWQTLQDPLSPITPPYDRLPQLAARFTRSNWVGFDVQLVADATRFRSDPLLTRQSNAQRSFVHGQLSHPWTAPGWFFTPKLQLHSTRYAFETPLADGSNAASRTLPTLSLDSGLVLERDASYFGRAFRQTLEPRAFYAYTPYRNQSLLPNYDSGASDFNFASIYSENPFGGNDRISDNNLLTLGLTSRLLDPQTGAEAVRIGMAQRLRFADQRVTLPGGLPASERLSDLLIGASVNWSPQWSMDGTAQYNPKTGRSIRSTLGGRYSPSDYRVVSAAYRLQRGSSEQLDIGWQWPINDLWGDKGSKLGAGMGQGAGRWYSVGRLNYSLADRKMVDSVFGFEYDAGCWLARIVAERLQSSAQSSSKRIMFQLEFVGFTRLGANPLRTLRDNIPRYQYLREQISTPSRFGNYE